MIDLTFITNSIEEYATAIFINQKAILENYNIIKNQVSDKSKIIPVLKNDAYGLGLEKIASLLKKYSDEYYVFNLQEALKLRKINKNCSIYVFLGCRDHQELAFLQNNFIPVLSTMKQINLWNNFAKHKKKILPCVIQVETGMNRFGIQKEDAELINKNPALISFLNVKHIFSHFACADQEHHPSVEEQYESFMEITKLLPKTLHSLAASYGIFKDKKYHLDIIRPGIALYGGNPTPWKDNPMKPVVYFYSMLMQIKSIKAGEHVGYGYLWEAKRPTLLATVPVGYGDGVLRTFTNNGYVMIEGNKVPIIGCISMDSLTLDITDLPVHLQKEGQLVELIGEDISIDEFSTWGGTIHCEVLNALSSRYPRFYIG